MQTGTNDRPTLAGEKSCAPSKSRPGVTQGLFGSNLEISITLSTVSSAMCRMMRSIFIVYKSNISCCKRLKNSKPQEKKLRELIDFSAKY
uniref:Uncharacterized protein n=1 Tax=Romanomermis culicivorax TaxID=13658 RepID=A0A915KG10_ROMCU